MFAATTTVTLVVPLHKTGVQMPKLKLSLHKAALQHEEVGTTRENLHSTHMRMVPQARAAAVEEPLVVVVMADGLTAST